jgi:hypothetical protein
MEKSKVFQFAMDAGISDASITNDAPVSWSNLTRFAEAVDEHRLRIDSIRSSAAMQEHLDEIQQTFSKAYTAGAAAGMHHAARWMVKNECVPAHIKPTDVQSQIDAHEQKQFLEREALVDAIRIEMEKWTWN